MVDAGHAVSPPGTLEEKDLSANPKDSAINRLDPRLLE
jgi:hypothetical protein